MKYALILIQSQEFSIIFDCLLLTLILNVNRNFTPFIHSFIHSGYFYSASSSSLLLRGTPDVARTLRQSFTPKRHRQLRGKDFPRSLSGGLRTRSLSGGLRTRSLSGGLRTRSLSGGLSGIRTHDPVDERAESTSEPSHPKTIHLLLFTRIKIKKYWNLPGMFWY